MRRLSDEEYQAFLKRLGIGATVTEDEWLYHFDHQNANARSGAEVGEEVPEFALPDQLGNVRNRDELMGEHGLLLVFARSADW